MNIEEIRRGDMSSVVRYTKERVRTRIVPLPPASSHLHSTLTLSLHSSTLRITNNLKVEFISIFQLSQSPSELHYSREVFIPSDRLTLALKELFPGVWVRQGNRVVALDGDGKREFSLPVQVD